MGKPIPNRDTSRDYINNDMLVTEWKKSEELDRATDELSRMFQILAKKVSGSFIYDSNDDRYDCVQHAYVCLMSNWKKIDLERRTNAFSYFTQIALNGLRQGWNTLNGKKKQTISISRIFEEDV